MMKKIVKGMALLMAVALAGSASAATTTFNGETITYTGASVSTVNGDLVLKFTSGTGSFTLPKNAQTRALIVGGGGAGGGDCGGGGGAGGVVELDSLFLKSGTYNVSVGAGGQPSGTAKKRGSNGSDSTLTVGSTVYRGVGGGAGGLYGDQNGSNGGSGGGSVSGSTRGTATQSQQGYGLGNNGGLGNNNNIGGGGGGAGGVGADRSGNVGGKGGDGIVSDITGEKVVYAAGGGGGDCENRTGGGVGGGAVVDGVTVSNVGGHGGCQYMTTVSGVETTVQQGRGFPGKDGTGSGGGGAGGEYGGGGYGGAGGSGIVVIRLTAIEKSPVCQIGSTTYTTLEAAIAAAQAGDTIELLKDITISSDVTVNKNVTITSTSGNNFKITRSANCALYVTADVALANVVIDGGQNWNNSTISSTTNGTNDPRGKSLIFVENGARLTLNSGATVQNLWGRKMDASDSDEYAGIHNAGTLVINDGALFQGLRHRAYDAGAYAAQKGGAIYSTGTVTMNGGTIKDCYSVGAGGAIYAAAGTVELKGGTIENCAAAQGGGAVYIAQNPPPPTVDYKWYRFVFTDTQNNTIMQLSELSLYDAAGNRVNQGTYTAGSSATGLTANQFYTQLSAGSFGGNGSESPDKLFDGNTGTKMCVVNCTLNGSNGNKVTLTFRLPDNAAPIASYTYTSGNDETPSRNPVSWTVEGSADGKNWTLLDTHANEATGLPTQTKTPSSSFHFNQFEATPATLKVSGSPTVSDNKKIADGATSGTINNVQPTAADQIVQTGDVSGAVGVSYPLTGSILAEQFGVHQVGTSADGFFYDGTNEPASISGDKLIWGNPVCRIGDTTFGSLSAALAAAADNDTIVLLRNVVLNESLFFNKPVTLTSEEGETFTITRNASHADKTMAVGSSVVFENITFDGGSTTGARLINVAANGNLTLGNGATIQHVYCSGAQAIQLNDDSAVLNIEKGAVISDCKNEGAATTGGAIRVNSGTLNMTGGTITGCANTNGDGGAIYVNEGTAVVNVTGGTITNCSASGAGGAITANEGTVNIYGGVITGNTAGTNGGAVQYGRNGGILAGGTITGNTAGTTAGGVYVKGPVQVYGSPKVVDNTVGGAANNLVPTYATQIQLKGTLTGRIGVSYPATAAEGAQFGAFKAGTGANNFVYDGGTYAGQISNGTLVWSSSAKPGPMPDDDDPDKPVDPVDPMYYIGSPQARPVDLDEFQATGAEVKRVGNDVVLIYTNPAAGGTLTIPSYAHARVMAVGGGAAGGTVGIGTEKGAGGGGGAGGMSELMTTLMPGEYQIQVGKGAERVDSYVQSWVGNNGGFSALVNPIGTYVTSAKGGGGGGAPKANGAGVEGGSGGGGSWWGVLTSGGSYTDGYGWYGAKPENENVAGGGGGAATAAADGAGKANGAGGAGRASDITGETVVYSAGGRGGDRTDLAYAPADGATPGSGGDGAGGVGPGGAGADGVVVVRLVDFFDMVKVPFPAYTDTFNWADGETLTAFDLSNFPESYQAAIASIDGQTNVNCSVEGGVTNGLGRQSFTITLKDGFVWDDGTTFGFDAPKTFFWRVREANVVGNAMAEVTKTVDWSDKTNAVIAITAHTTPEIRRLAPKVLFLGSLCDAHEFSPTVLAAALNAVTEVGSVDYYLFNAVQDKSAAAPAYQGSLPKGGIFDPSIITMKESNHSSLYGFYDTLAQLIDEGKNYDYVIFSFDRSLTASYFPGTHDHERQVVDFLKPLYEQNRVIWLVDNQSSGPTSPAISQTPWYPNQLVYVHFSADNQSNYWGSLYDWESNWGSAKGGTTEAKVEASWQGLHALLGMFDPSSYETITRAIYDANYIADKNSITAAKVAATAGSVYPNQVIYDSASAVAETIRSIVKPLDYTISLNDNIYLASGLKLNQVYGCWTTNQADIANTVGDYVNEVPAGWYPLTAGENLFPTDAGVSIKLPTISTEAWIRLWLDVSDTGRFLSSIDATYNTKTGLWQKDPNNGPVVVATTPDGGEAIIAEDQAATDVQWSFKAFVLTGTVESNTNGLYTGDILVNGYSTNWVAVGENSSPQAVFRGAPGYILDRLVVDGEDVDFSIVTSDWIFEYINSDHDVKVWYKPYFVEDPPPPVTGPVTNIYDGTAYGPTVTNVNFTEDIPYEWFPVYSFESNGVYSATNGQVNVVWGEDGTPQPTNVYVRIAVKQPGYEEPVVLDNWTGINEVVILPREITIQYEDFVQTNATRKTGDFDWHLVESLNVTNQLVEGDYITETGSSCSEYPGKGEHTEDTISTDPANVAVHNPDGTVNDNYIVHVLPGDYYYPDLSIVAIPEGVEKVYDAKPEGIDVEVTLSALPTAAEIKALHSGNKQYNNIGTIAAKEPVIMYSTDGVNYSTEYPTFTDVGTHTVYFKVDCDYTVEHWRWSSNKTTDTLHFPTVYGQADVIIHPRPVTVTADSAFKYYDGTPLTDGGYTVAEATDVTGFVEGEGATFAMTSGSTITNPGTQPNVIDPSKTQATGDTKLSNYEFVYEPGTLTVRDKLLSTPTSVEKVYDGKKETIGVDVTRDSGLPISSDDYTIKYSQYPDDPNSWTNDLSFVNVGVSNEVWYVVEAEGYDPITNKAYVTIWPREVVVTADDKEKIFGTPDPELTWTISDGTNGVGETVGILPSETNLVLALIGNDPRHDIERDKAGTPEGEQKTPEGEPGYPITVDGSEYMGNYHFTYVPGELRIIPAIFSSNIHGLLKINSPYANTIIPAPWKGYTRQGTPDLDIRVDRLVKPRNLTEGDQLLYFASNGVYKAWYLEFWTNEVTHVAEGVWTPMATVLQSASPDPSDVIKSLKIAPRGDETQKRGYGMWLIRQKPVDETGAPIPFYLHGQWMTGVETITIFGLTDEHKVIKYEGAEYQPAADTMLADPDCTRDSVINNHVWGDTNLVDTLIINTDRLQNLYCLHREKAKRAGGGIYPDWYYWGDKQYYSDIKTTPGIGFWYVRRVEGDMTLTWAGDPQYMGEAEPHAVWIVDHADAGNGKTHLAFKLEEPLAPAKVTPEYIRELFDAGCIRYLHTTGETQKAGKAAMDALDEEKDAKIVPALRNGTGIATDDPKTDPDLAKGWIWVTVDVPDGATEKSAKDGTGDTNGAGDLWRIVIGRGIW